MLVFRAVSWTTLSSTVAMIGLQIPFLMKFRGPALKKGFSGISVALNCAKFVFALVTYFLKASALAGASTTPDLDELKQWEHRKAKDNAQCGLRPVSPDGLPYIGRPKNYDNLTVAAGHAMMGWSMGPATGKLVTELISGHKLSMDISPFDPQRKF